MTKPEFAALSGWAIAEHFGCQYYGDGSPVPHGGVFYDMRDWQRYGYANVVNIYKDPEGEPIMTVERGTLNKPEDMQSAFDCAGTPKDQYDNPAAQIEAVFAACGVEPDSVNPWSYFPIDDEDRLWEETEQDLKLLGS